MQSSKECSLAAIFTFIEEAPPFARFRQLEAAGVDTIYILLDSRIFEKACNQKFPILEYGNIASILEHYQASAPNLNFEFLDTGNIISEEKKLQFYLNAVQPNHALNIFVCQNDIPNISQQIPVLRRACIETQTWFGVSFFKTETREKIPTPDKFSFHKSVIELMQRKKNSCIVIQQNRFDLVHTQWLFYLLSGFVSAHFKPDSYIYSEVTRLINTYNTQTAYLEKAQAAFEDTGHKLYTSENPTAFLEFQHANNRTDKKGFEENIDILLQKISRLCLQNFNGQNRISFAP